MTGKKTRCARRSHLVPTANWFLEHVRPSSRTRQLAKWDTETTAVAVGAMQEEADAIASSSKLMERLDKALAEHLNSHLLFYAETVADLMSEF